MRSEKTTKSVKRTNEPTRRAQQMRTLLFIALVFLVHILIDGARVTAQSVVAACDARAAVSVQCAVRRTANTPNPRIIDISIVCILLTTFSIQCRDQAPPVASGRGCNDNATDWQRAFDCAAVADNGCNSATVSAAGTLMCRRVLLLVCARTHTRAPLSRRGSEHCALDHRIAFRSLVGCHIARRRALF